jgi:hypothetical protein
MAGLDSREARLDRGQQIEDQQQQAGGCALAVQLVSDAVELAQIAVAPAVLDAFCPPLLALFQPPLLFLVRAQQHLADRSLD